MGGLFSSPDTSGQEKQLELQRKQIEAQEKRTQEASAREGAALQAKYRARRGAGMRSLLSEEREDSMLGIGTEYKS
jgi:hypothetical protein